MFQLCKFKTQHHCRYCTRKKMKKKNVKMLTINKITLENKINKLGIEIYSIIQYEIPKML